MGTLQRLVSRGISTTLHRRLVAAASALPNCPAFSECLARTSSSASIPHDSQNAFTTSKVISKRDFIASILDNCEVYNSDVRQSLINISGKAEFNAHNLEATLVTLIDINFSAATAVKMVTLHPGLLTEEPSQIYEAWDAWCSVIPQGGVRYDLLMSSPWLLSEGKKNIKSIFRQVRAVVGSHRHAAQVIKNSPHIMFHSVEELRQVSDYISIRMFVRNPAEYYKSTALTHPLSEVKLRHVFLERCGRYKRPNFRQSELVPTENPKLSEIYDTTSEEFATKIAGLTLEEFVVFRDLFEKEIEDNLENDNSDDDSSSDTEE